LVNSAAIMKRVQTNWDRLFARSGRVFNEPHEDMPQLIDQMKRQGTRTVLDLGCGSGRHLVQLAGHGFEVHGVDSSPHAVRLARGWLESRQLRAQVILHDITTPLPYGREYFDAVVSIQVVHHAVSKTIRRIAREIERVTKPEALIFVTVPRSRNQASRFEEIEPGTLVPLDGPEKGLPHHFFTAKELESLFAGFNRLDLHVDRADHLCFTGMKRCV
jgi:cyclopropane fatty-acyl-phospholipid synthase-like methyltransferase